MAHWFLFTSLTHRWILANAQYGKRISAMIREHMQALEPTQFESKLFVIYLLNDVLHLLGRTDANPEVSRRCDLAYLGYLLTNLYVPVCRKPIRSSCSWRI